MAAVFDATGLSAAGLGAFKVFRALRALRPLRMISRQRGLRIIVKTLIKSFTDMLSVSLFGMEHLLISVLNVCCVLTSISFHLSGLVIMLMFAILGVQFYGGQLRCCRSPEYDQCHSDWDYSDTPPLPLYWNRTRCQEEALVSPELGYMWSQRWPQHFDNVGSALLTLFECITTELWATIMCATFDFA